MLIIYKDNNSTIGYWSVSCTLNGMVAGMRGTWMIEVLGKYPSKHGCSYGDVSDGNYSNLDSG